MKRTFLLICDILATLGLLAALVGFLVTCTGCGPTRETAKAQKQADQALEASQEIIRGQDTRDAIVAMDLTPEQNEAIGQLFAKVYELVSSARESLAPGLTILSQGKPVEVSTTAEQARLDFPAFHREATKQTARAEVEAEQFLWYTSITNRVLSWGSVAAQSAFGVVTGGTGGALGLLAIALKLLQMHKRGTKAIDMMAEYSIEAAEAKDEPELERIKKRHQEAQEAAGVHGIIAKRLKAKKKKTTPPTDMET